MAGTCDLFPWLPWCPGSDQYEGNPAQPRKKDPANRPNLSDLSKARVSLRSFLSFHGWRGKDLDVMTAVVLAEGRSEIDSSGKINCRANYAGCCYGPFQINVRDNGDVDRATACDWNKAASYSYKLYKSRGFQPWEAYTNGSYRRELGKDITIYAFPTVVDSAAEALDKVSPIHDVGTAIQALNKLIGNIFDPSFWLRSGKVIFGSLLFLIGVIALVMAMLNSPTGRSTVKTATKVATKGAV